MAKRSKKTTTQTESLFNTGAYSSKQPVGDFTHAKYDSGWDTGAAFPKTSELNETSTSVVTIEDSSKKLSEDSDRWNPTYFGEEPPREISTDGQLTIFFDNSYEAPEPDDFKSVEEFEAAWDVWEKEELARQVPTQFLEDKSEDNNQSDKFLEDNFNCDFQHTVYENTHENFLEDLGSCAASDKKPKGRNRKGCLYKYLENKKLKDGTIVSYPRVIDDKRDPDNTKHWRWGFNWEEKIDGEWKNRSIGVPQGAVFLVIGMQNNAAPLQEIIDFIKRSKCKGDKKKAEKKKNKGKNKKSPNEARLIS